MSYVWFVIATVLFFTALYLYWMTRGGMEEVWWRIAECYFSRAPRSTVVNLRNPVHFVKCLWNYENRRRELIQIFAQVGFLVMATLAFGNINYTYTQWGALGWLVSLPLGAAWVDAGMTAWKGVHTHTSFLRFGKRSHSE